MPLGVCVCVCITVLETGRGKMGELGVVGRVVNIDFFFFRYSLWDVRVCISSVDSFGAVRVFYIRFLSVSVNT